MDQENGDLNDLTETDGTIGGFGFHDGWTRGVMVIRLSHTSLFQFLGHPFDNFAVLSMNHRREIVFPSCEHNIEEFTITKFKSFIRHIQFA